MNKKLTFFFFFFLIVLHSVPGLNSAFTEDIYGVAFGTIILHYQWLSSIQVLHIKQGKDRFRLSVVCTRKNSQHYTQFPTPSSTDGVILFPWRRGSTLGTYISIDHCWILHMPLPKSISFIVWKQYTDSTSNIQKGLLHQVQIIRSIFMNKYTDSIPHFP